MLNLKSSEKNRKKLKNMILNYIYKCKRDSFILATRKDKSGWGLCLYLFPANSHINLLDKDQMNKIKLKVYMLNDNIK